MMEPVFRITEGSGNPNNGKVNFSLGKASWNLGMFAAALVLCPITYSHSALIIFLLTTYFSLLIGHSVGMHRMMIHRSFIAPKWLERLLIYIGVLVGMAGPYSVVRIHDVRDWAQRQSNCHRFFSHEESFLKDVYWQLTSIFEFDLPPKLKIESKLVDDRFYQFLEKTWRWHQLPIAALLFLWGGIAFVVWGVCARVAISVIGHWSITHFCHNPGPGRWRVKGAAVQASNFPGLGILTYGECWHNNHHAFPESARIGLEKGQCDPSWRFIQVLQRLGLASQVCLPRDQDQQEDIYVSS